MKSKFFLFAAVMLLRHTLVDAQTLTISSAGQTGTSGTNWSVSNGLLYYTGDANVQASVITNALANGNLTIQAISNNVSVNVNQGITSTANGSGIIIGNSNSIGTVTFNRTVDIYGPVTVHADKINMGAEELTPGESAKLLTRVSSGHISLLAKNGFETLANANCIRGKIHTIGGGNIHITSDADNNGSGALNIDWLTIDGGSGGVLMEGASYNWSTANNCPLPEFYGTGDFTFRPTSNTLTQGFTTLWIAMFQNKKSITFGSQANKFSALTLEPCVVCLGTPINGAGSSLTAHNGPIELYSRDITVNHNLTTTASGSSILLDGSSIIQASAIKVETNAGNITYNATNAKWNSGNNSAIRIGNGGATSAKIFAQGGNISLSTSFAATGTSGGSDRAILIDNAEIVTTGVGTINIVGDATNNGSTTINAWGIAFENNSRIQTQSGNLTLDGTGGKANSNSRGIVIDNKAVSILSNSGAINVFDRLPTGLTGTYTGLYFRPNAANSIVIGADATNVASSSSNINIEADRATFDIQPSRFNTSGTVSVRSIGSSFGAEFSTTNLNVESTSTGLTLGKTSNTSNVVLNRAHAIAGPISVYGGTVAVNQNLTTTLASAPILLQSTGAINIASSRTVQSNGGHITLRSNAGGTALTNASSIILNSGSSLLSQGGNITLGGNFTGAQGAGLYAASGNAPAILLNGGTISAAGGTIKLYGKCNASYDDGIRLLGTVNTTGNGVIELYGEAHGGYNGTDYFGGITFGSSAGSTIETENGNIVLNGLLTNTQSNTTGAINFYRNDGSAGQTRHINLLSKTGNININADIGSTGAYGIGHSSWGNVYIGSPASGWTATGNIVLSYARLDHAVNNGFKVKTTGAVTYEPTASSFTAAQTFPPNSNYTVAQNASSLTIGKASNTADITMAASTTVAGPITIYGGNININENLNTSSGTSSGNVLIKGSADVILAASKSITTSGAPVILWANSDNEATNGSIALRNGSSIVTGSGSVAGGHVWIGGGSNGTTWNGLAVGNGYAVPGTSFTPSNGGGALQAGIYLERNSISSFGGNIKIAGDGAATARGIVTYGNTVAINAGSGKIDIDGQVTSSAAGNRGGVLFGMHDVSIASTVDISSSSTSGDAITINGVGRGTEDAIALSGTLNITSSGGGNIVLNGNALGSGRSIVAGNYYHGVMNVFANSGNIVLNGNTKAVQVATQIIGGLTSGPSKINIGQGGTISSSSSDVFITADNIALAAGGIAINASGQVTLEPASNSFASAITFPIANLSISNNISGLTIGKPSNTANITIGGTTSIAGAITAYGGSLAINENLSSSTGSTISLYGNTLSFGSGKTVSSANGQLIVAPQNPALTIGMAGATGDLSLPASYFSTNFTNGFSNIQIGSENQTGAISTNAFNLQDNMTLLTSGALNLVGKPALGANNLTLGQDITTVNVGTPANYFQTNGSGRVIRAIPNADSRLFPVGGSQYNPVTITNNSGAADDFLARVLDAVYEDGLSGNLIDVPHLSVTWDLGKANANGGSGVNFSFQWHVDQETDVMPEYALNHHNGSNWEIASGTTNAPVGATIKTMSHEGYTGGFSPFAVGPSPTSALPVELIGIQVNCLNEGKNAEITWQTASELNSDKYIIERSRDGLAWENIGEIQAAGTTTQLSQYSFVDNQTRSSNVVYYRLTQVDLDGTSTVYPPLSSSCEMSEEVVLFPNPARTQVFVQMVNAKEENVRVEIRNQLGALVSSRTQTLQEGMNLLNIDIAGMNSGQYMIVLVTESKEPQMIKFVKMD